MPNERTEESGRTKVGVASIVLIVACVGLSACLSLVIWVLGVGIDRATHYAMGVAFFVVNITCLVALLYFLQKGKLSFAIVLSIIPTPVIIGLVFILAIGCAIFGNKC